MNEVGRAAQILGWETSIGIGRPVSTTYLLPSTTSPPPALWPLPPPWIYNLAE